MKIRFQYNSAAKGGCGASLMTLPPFVEWVGSPVPTGWNPVIRYMEAYDSSRCKRTSARAGRDTLSVISDYMPCPHGPEAEASSARQASARTRTRSWLRTIVSVRYSNPLAAPAMLKGRVNSALVLSHLKGTGLASQSHSMRWSRRSGRAMSSSAPLTLFDNHDLLRELEQDPSPINGSDSSLCVASQTVF